MSRRRRSAQPRGGRGTNGPGRARTTTTTLSSSEIKLERSTTAKRRQLPSRPSALPTYPPGSGDGRPDGRTPAASRPVDKGTLTASSIITPARCRAGTGGAESGLTGRDRPDAGRAGPTGSAVRARGNDGWRRCEIGPGPASRPATHRYNDRERPGDRVTIWGLTCT